MVEQMEYNRNELLQHVQSAIDNGKTAFVVSTIVIMDQVVQDVRDGYPNYFRAQRIGQLHDQFDGTVHPGFILEKTCTFFWPFEASIGTFFSLLTGDGLDELAAPVGSSGCPRILIGSLPPEHLLYQWITWGVSLGGQMMEPQQKMEFKNLCRHALDAMSIIYVECPANQVDWFYDWLVVEEEEQPHSG